MYTGTKIVCQDFWKNFYNKDMKFSFFFDFYYYIYYYILHFQIPAGKNNLHGFRWNIDRKRKQGNAKNE